MLGLIILLNAYALCIILPSLYLIKKYFEKRTDFIDRHHKDIAMLTWFGLSMILLLLVNIKYIALFINWLFTIPPC